MMMESKDMDIEDLVAVHMTDYLPVNGEIKSLNSVFPNLSLRNTVHFALNHPVASHIEGNWDNRKYAVLAPLKNLSNEKENHLTNFNVVDTFFVGDVKLPKGSTVIASPYAHEDLIDHEIVDRDTLISRFGDERNIPQSGDYLVVEKEGIKYVILGWNNGDLREETSLEITRQGYKSVSADETHWVDEDDLGMSPSNKTRIAEKLFVKRGIHSGSIFDGLEYYSGCLIDITLGDNKKKVEDYLQIVREFGGVDEVDKLITNDSNCSIFSRNQFNGWNLLSGVYYDVNNLNYKLLVGALKKTKGNLPLDFHGRIDTFIDTHEKILRSFVPEEVLNKYQLVFN